mmetsp:Transcript_43025/g.101172  ORF Transcript_43025/g.101172 Transcript_43025/m.101172 type:complete len:364 (+) Transcript_43025:475-1566(+)
MNHLPLEPAVEPIVPPARVQVHRRVQLLSDEVLARRGPLEGRARVRRHGKVRDADLDVEDPGEHVRDDEEREDERRRGEVRREVRQREGVEDHRANLRRAHVDDDVKVEEKQPALNVEVPARERHDGVEQIVLVADQELCGGVKMEDLVVVLGVRAPVLELLVRDGEHRHVLNVRVVHDRVGHDVVRVMRALPPARRDPRQQRANHDPDQDVRLAVVGDAVVGRIVSDKGALLKEQRVYKRREQRRAKAIRCDCQVDSRGEDGAEPQRQAEVERPRGVIHAISFNLFSQLAEVYFQLALRVRREGCHVRQVPQNLFRLNARSVGCVECMVNSRGVLASEVVQKVLSSWVMCGPLGEIVHLIID